MGHCLYPTVQPLAQHTLAELLNARVSPPASSPLRGHARVLPSRPVVPCHPSGGALITGKALLEHFGGDRQLLGELARIFLDDCPSRLSAIREAVERRDAGALLEAAHALRGSVANFGATRAVAAALRLELMGKAGDLAAAPAALADLQQTMAAFAGELDTVAEPSAR